MKRPYFCPDCEHAMGDDCRCTMAQRARQTVWFLWQARWWLLGYSVVITACEMWVRR